MVSPDAMKQLDELQADIRKAVVKTMKELEDNPTKSRPKADIKKLAGIKRKPSLYRLRAGEYRVIYEVTEGKVWISEIIKRSAAYKFIPP
ncbi:MAG: type II toxin-antitoxin system RelE/ParE family toxin [Euryarchaeota archaeon]|nr:type II toxin-antitoxin system RelE/ParE family toxin [Euryarchaeota archaeon]